MLNVIIICLSLIASAIGTLATEIYVAKKVNKVTARLNNKAY
jgi:hypothetical protein